MAEQYREEELKTTVAVSGLTAAEELAAAEAALAKKAASDALAAAAAAALIEAEAQAGSDVEQQRVDDSWITVEPVSPTIEQARDEPTTVAVSGESFAERRARVFAAAAEAARVKEAAAAAAAELQALNEAEKARLLAEQAAKEQAAVPAGPRYTQISVRNGTVWALDTVTGRWVSYTPGRPSDLPVAIAAPYLVVPTVEQIREEPTEVAVSGLMAAEEQAIITAQRMEAARVAVAAALEAERQRKLKEILEAQAVLDLAAAAKLEEAARLQRLREAEAQDAARRAAVRRAAARWVAEAAEEAAKQQAVDDSWIVVEPVVSDVEQYREEEVLDITIAVSGLTAEEELAKIAEDLARKAASDALAAAEAARLQALSDAEKARMLAETSAIEAACEEAERLGEDVITVVPLPVVIPPVVPPVVPPAAPPLVEDLDPRVDGAARRLLLLAFVAAIIKGLAK